MTARCRASRASGTARRALATKCAAGIHHAHHVAGLHVADVRDVGLEDPGMRPCPLVTPALEPEDGGPEQLPVLTDRDMAKSRQTDLPNAGISSWQTARPAIYHGSKR